jgi:hypothetical protein
LAETSRAGIVGECFGEMVIKALADLSMSGQLADILDLDTQ